MKSEIEKGFDELYELNCSGFRAVCGLLYAQIRKQALGRALTTQELYEATLKGDQYFWSVLEPDEYKCSPFFEEKND